MASSSRSEATASPADELDLNFLFDEDEAAVDVLMPIPGSDGNMFSVKILSLEGLNNALASAEPSNAAVLGFLSPLISIEDAIVIKAAAVDGFYCNRPFLIYDQRFLRSKIRVGKELQFVCDEVKDAQRSVQEEREKITDCDLLADVTRSQPENSRAKEWASMGHPQLVGILRAAHTEFQSVLDHATDVLGSIVTGIDEARSEHSLMNM